MPEQQPLAGQTMDTTVAPSAIRRPARVRPAAGVLLAALLGAAGCDLAQFDALPQRNPPKQRQTFVNWETPHVSPLAVSADGRLVLAVNTPDNRLELFEWESEAPGPGPDAAGSQAAGTLVWRESIPVGLEPVSVRIRDERTAWVANHLSDSVSVVDLVTRAVIRTLPTGDEPCDIAFAADRAFVTCSQIDEIWVYELAEPDLAPRKLNIQGKDPRALAVAADGRTVYAAIFESGSHTTLVAWEDVSAPHGPYGGRNPPPNAGAEFLPPIGVHGPPPVSLIVRKHATGAWLDDNGADWRAFVSWDLHDHDLAVIDAETLAVRYVPGLMTTNMHLTALPGGGVAVVGTEAHNEIRFEPNLNGRFLDVRLALVAPEAFSETAPDAARDNAVARIDLNPHLVEPLVRGELQVAPEVRARSLADPRAVVFNSTGQRGYIAGLGSNNVIVVDQRGERLAERSVGAGPTGLVLHEPPGGPARLYVLARFEAAITVLDPESLAELAAVSFYDPTPPEIRAGRPFLYDAQRTSGPGHVSCASCHVDARTDQLAWDLGDPTGARKSFNQTCNHPFFGLPVGECEDWHPMKGPMTTQTLQHIIGTEPFHWRGDRENLAAFNPAFVGLLGRAEPLTEDELRQFEAFLATIRFPPNPNRNLDGSLRDWLDLGDPGLGAGSPIRGEEIFFGQRIDLSAVRCADCHNVGERGAGTNRRITPRELLINPHQSIDVPQIRNMYEKRGFSRTRTDNRVGFGHNHDGTIDGMINFFHIPNFTGFSPGPAGAQERRDVIAFVMSVGYDTHPAVGQQVTLAAGALDRLSGPDAESVARLLRLADAREIGLIVKGRIAGTPRGWMYRGAGVFQSDRRRETITTDELLALAGPGQELTWTAVPAGSERRLGIDRNNDGRLDGDE